MALFYPFDETLDGHMEIVEVNTADLQFPIFIFPKGSFFVNKTYGIIKGTRTIIRPGIDYNVLSCNQDIPFSPYEETDKLIKSNFVRNAVMILKDEPMVIEWHVAYCGGEDETKPDEYRNLLNSLYTKAQTDATLNYFLTKRQGWGVYLSSDNTQIMQGKYINTHYFQQDEERAEGNFNGLGWGKVELAMHSLADTVSSGTDPLLLEAFFNWVTHNETEFNKVKDGKFDEINNGLNNLKGKRVGEEQFVYLNNDEVIPRQNFIEHKNLTLRGINPKEVDAQTTSVVSPMRKGVGFRTLADCDYREGIEATPTVLKQLKPDSHVDKRINVNLKFSKPEYETEGSLVSYQILIEEDFSKDPSASYTIYVVSKLERRTIQIIPRTANSATTAHSAAYNYLMPTSNADTYFVYALDANKQLINGSTDTAAISITNTSDAVVASISGLQSTVGNGVGPTAGVGEYVVVTVTKLNPASAHLMEAVVYDGLTDNVLKTTSIQTVKDIAQTKAIIEVGDLKPENGYLRIVVKYANVATIIATSLIGFIVQSPQKMAYIEVIDNAEGTAVPMWDITAKRASYLKVTFSEDPRFHETSVNPVVTTLNGLAVSCSLGEPNYISDNVAVYKMSFYGTVETFFTLSLSNSSGTLVTNSVNLSLEDAYNAIPATNLTDFIIRGANLHSYQTNNNWTHLFEFNTSLPNGVIMDIVNESADIVYPSSCIIDNGVINIKAVSNRYLYEEFKFTLRKDDAVVEITVPESNLLGDVTIQPYVKFANHNVNAKNLLLDEFFNFTIQNPVIGNTVTLTLRDYKSTSDVTDVGFFNPSASTSNPVLFTNDVFSKTVVIAGGESANLNKAICKMVNLTNKTKYDANLVGKWCPPYDVVVKDSGGSVVAVYDLEKVINLEVYEPLEVTIVNTATNTAEYRHSKSEEDFVIIAEGLSDEVVFGIVDSGNEEFSASVKSVNKPSTNEYRIRISITAKPNREYVAKDIPIKLTVTKGGLVEYYLITNVGVVE